LAIFVRRPLTSTLSLDPGCNPIGQRFVAADKRLSSSFLNQGGLDRGNHVIIITRGPVDIDGFREIFRNVVNATRSLLYCKVLIDFQEASCQLEPGDIHAFAENLRPEYWPPTNKVALVSESDPHDYRQLCVLSAFLPNREIKNAVFEGTRAAVNWLADAI
jgi:hypothetical protein